MKFSTKIDWWILLLYISALGFVFFSSVVLFIHHQGTDIPLGLGGVLACLGVLFITVPTYYVIEDERLLVRAGPFRWRIPLDRILEVHRTNNPLSAPAWSLKRLHLRYLDAKGRERFALISPKLQKEFLKTLQQRAPGLEFAGDRLIRKPESQPPGGKG